LIDAFEIKELVLLMLSYLISDTHNQFTRRSETYERIQIINEVSV